MKNVFAFILLLVHVNCSMFIAQVDELDSFDRNGQQNEDINSLVEYVATAFHIKHHPLKDSDDDNARYFHASKFEDYDFSQLGVPKRNDVAIEKAQYPPHTDQPLQSVSLDIQGPPPKA